MSEFQKHVVYGKVGVLVSPGFGAGWSTWSGEDGESMAMDSRIVEAFIRGGSDAAKAEAEKLHPGCYLGGASDLTIEWVDQGSRFTISEYDGSETLHVHGPDDGWVA